MDKNEIIAEIAALRERLRILEEKVAGYEDVAADPESPVIDLMEVVAPAVEAEMPAAPAPASDAVGPAAEAAPQEASAPEPAFAPESAPAPAPEARAWRWMDDMPGAPVRNIRSGISLYDRALFINTLFREDYALYDRTISDLNGLTTLPAAVDYVQAHFPDWDLGSDAVYTFMMALRKKLR